ncbi:DNA recombination protein RmuC [Rubrivivax gelatinosus]|nr:DNA recombination protein RmuC [Rubrivivax gelatinosus]
MQRIEQQLRAFTETTGDSLSAARKAIDEQLERSVAEARSGRGELSQSFQSFEGRLAQQITSLAGNVDARLSALQTTTSESLEANRKVVDEKLGQSLEEARSGRVELTNAFGAFESKLEQRFATFDQALGGRFDALQAALTDRLDASSKALLDLLTQAQTDAALARAETTQALTGFRTEMATHLATVSQETVMSREALAASAAAFEQRIQERFEALTNATRGTLDSLKADVLNQLGVMSTAMKEQMDLNGTQVEQRFAAFGTELGTRFEALQAALNDRLEASSKALLDLLSQAQTDAAHARAETAQALTGFRTEMATHLATVSQETVKSREALAASAAAFEERIQERFEALTVATRGTLDSLKADVLSQLGVMSTAMKEQLDGNGNQVRNQFATLQDAVAQQLGAMAQGSQTNSEQLRSALNERLAAIQKDNTEKLEEMRRTVDEKLHATLEQRLGDSFKLVSERLEQVHTGLGEMKNLAGSVGDLKRVMTNVRNRGTWGEVQLGAIIESLLTAEQFARNVKTVPGSNDLVEYAVKMPGRSDDAPVWLPMDSKYPVEHYQRLLDAHETMEKTVIQQAMGAFESSIRAEAKKIASKYVSPPHTTDFAILFLPTEGLFAEVARIPGLVEALQNEHRVVVAGPTTLAAMLNSLRLGFRTLAIEKRSSEVWGILGSVKTEFRKFGDIVESTKKSIDAAAKKFDEVGVRTRAVERKLRDVQELPAVERAPALTAGDLLPLEEDGATSGVALPG